MRIPKLFGLARPARTPRSPRARGSVRSSRSARLRSSSRLSRVLAGVAITALGLTACQAIPDSGPVEAGLPNLLQTEQPVLFSPNGPVVGASQEDIVRGFLTAGSSSTDDYAIAREFLTPDYAHQWDPYSEVLVDEGARPYHSIGEEVGVLELPAIASVAKNGRLSPVPPGPETEVRFEFEKVGGEWRIASAPTGIILDRSTFEAAWAPHSVYFISGPDRLVPETRWFVNSAGTATQIIAELLAGPDEERQGVVRTGFPAGTSLTSSSVPVINGTARIDLSNEMVGIEPGSRKEIERQVAASLQSVQGLTSFELYADGSLIAEGPVGIDDEGPIGSEEQGAAALQNGELGLLVGGEVQPFEGLSEEVNAQRPRAISLAYDLDGAATLNGRELAWVTEDETVVIGDSSGMLGPSVDLVGRVWTYSSRNPGSLTVTTPGVGVVEFKAPWLEGRTPVAVRVSPQGSRIAALVSAGDGTSEVLMAGVIRDGNGVPTAVTENAEVQLWSEGEPIDLDWVDELRFAVLTRTDSTSKVTVGWKGSFPSDAGSVPGGTQISSGGNRLMLRVLDRKGDVFAPQGSGWQRQASDVQVLAKRG